MRKPEPRIFEHALGRIGLAGQACVFIDDIEANIMAARGLGIAGIHHRDAADHRRWEVRVSRSNCR